MDMEQRTGSNLEKEYIKTLESPLDCKGINLVNPKGNQSWVFIGRTDAETEATILWSPDGKNWFIWKNPYAGKIEGRRRGKQDEMSGWHLKIDGYEFEQALGVGNWQAGLACCSPWGHKESESTERLNWTELNYHWIKIYNIN